MLILPIVICLSILGILAALTIISFIAYIFFDTDGFGALFFFGLTILAAIALAVTAVPFDSKYWYVTPTNGTISNIESKMVLASEGSTELAGKFVITLEDDGEAVIISDPRIQNYEVGDKLELNCSYGWSYSGLDTKNCSLLG